MKKFISLALTLLLAFVSISTASAASIKGKKLSFTANWNASMSVPATETRVYNCGSLWQGVVVKQNVDANIYKKVTFEYESTAEWYNFNVTDEDPKDPTHYGIGFSKGKGTLNVDLTTYTGLIKELFIQNVQPSDTYTTLKIFNAYFTKANGSKEEIQLGGLNWGNGGMSYENPITHAGANFIGQWGSLQLNGANDIECGIKLRLYTKSPIPYGKLQYCLVYSNDPGADGNGNDWPQLTKITDTYAECTITKPVKSLMLQWTSPEAGSIDIEAITYERLDGKDVGDDASGDYDFYKMTDVKAVPGIQTFSSEILGGAHHKHTAEHREIYHPVSSVKFNIEEEDTEGEKKEDPTINVTIRKFDGTAVCPASVKIIDNMPVVEAAFPLDEGDYKVTFAPETFVINDQICTEELSFIVSALNESNTLVEDAKMIVLNELDSYENISSDFIYGVNVYQYAPGLEQKIADAIEEAKRLCDLYAEEENVYSALADFRKFFKSIRPNLPKADSKYAIKHKATGLYLNIEGDKVTLEKEATPIEFHLVDPSEAPNVDKYNISSTYHHAYIYSTPERKYLGYNMTEREVGEGDAKITEIIPTTTNKRNTVWYVQASSFNTYYIEIYPLYEEAKGWQDLYAPNYGEEGVDVTCCNKDIDWEKEYPGANEGKGIGYYWFIEDYVAPKSNLPEGCIAITNEAELEGQTVLIMNAETEKFLYGPNAQNTGVADFETATASTNVVTAYKVEKADNGYLFRCVTPAGGDYSLWGANPCYLNAQPNVGGVSFNLGKDQDIANGSTWSLTYNAKAKVWTIQSVANEGYLAGTTISKELEAKWVICTALEGTGSSSADDATAISSIETANNAAAIYNAAGVRSNTLQKGINIVKLANGQVKKVFIK